MNLLTCDVQVNGKKYKLQHPGNREWLKIKQTLFKVSSDGIDLIPLLDYFFEHCCFPESGEQLNLDNIPLAELEEVWSLVAPRFFRGTMEAGYIYPVGAARIEAGGDAVNPA